MNTAKFYIPRQERSLSPQDYLREMERSRHNIESIHFEPPEIGKPGYGRFRVKYRIPVLVAE